MLLGRLCDGLEAAVQSIQRSMPVQAPPEAPDAAARPAPGGPSASQVAGGIPEALVCDRRGDRHYRSFNAITVTSSLRSCSSCTHGTIDCSDD